MIPKVYVIAGEPSGDALGARLMEGLKDLTGGNVEIVGVGGPLMEAEGLKSLYPIRALSVMGLVEILTSIPRIYGLIRRTVADIRESKPDVVVTIDAQTFSHWIAKRLYPAPCPIVHYVAPTVWAWKPWRAKHLAKLVDRVLMLFAFEKPYFDTVGLDAVVVGHPVAERELPDDAGVQFRQRHEIGSDDRLVCLLPGSRTGEVRRHLPVFRRTIEMLARDHASLRFVLPTIGHVEQAVRQDVATWPVPVTVIANGEDEKFAALRACEVALAASGTVTLEMSAAGLPSVVVYRANPLTAAIVRRIVRVPYASMANIIAGREVMPEFLQESCTPDNLANAVGRLLDEEDLRLNQKTAMTDIVATLGKGGEPPHLRAAKAVLEMVTDR